MARTHHSPSIEGLITAAVLAALTASLPPQRQFDQLRKRGLPADHDQSLAVAAGDVDGDGDLDLVVGNDAAGTVGQQNRLYLNDGTGVYTDASATHLPAARDITFAVAMGDVDGDGDPDIVLGNYPQDRLYLNDGTGRYTDATLGRMPADNDWAGDVELGDVDGDGHLDLVVANQGYSGGSTQNRLYLNDGTGRFNDMTAMRMPVQTDQTYTVALEDVDGDGDADLVFGNDGQNRLYRNDGTGTFTDTTAMNLPADADTTSSMALDDVDGDGDPDLLFGNRATPSGGGQNRLYVNDGTGAFLDVTSAQLPANLDGTESVVLCDLDADGDVDLVSGNGGYSGEQNRLYLNDGSGRFADATASHLPFDLDSTHAIVCPDVDGDGDRDLVLAGFDTRFFIGQQNRLLLNDGSGAFADATDSRLPMAGDRTQAVASPDVDRDGDLDLVCGNSGGQNRLYVNEGNGKFHDATGARMPADNDLTRSVASGDVDGDGDTDLVFGNGGQNRLYRNDGTSRFVDATATHMPADADSTNVVALGDVDGDGDLDMVTGNGSYWTYGQQNRLYLNDGTGFFTDATNVRVPADTEVTLGVVLGDVDGDDDLDLVLANHHTRNRLYLNDGTGTFTDSTTMRMPSDNDGSHAVALGDVDGDGDSDVVFGNYGTQSRLYLNDGRGTFIDATAMRVPTDNDKTSAVVLGDVDADGDIDLTVGNQGGWVCEPSRSGSNLCALSTSGAQNRLYLNDGHGFFADATARLPAFDDSTLAVTACDLDADGDSDIVFGNGGENRILLNLLHQFDSPLMARLGQPYMLDVYGRYGEPRLVDVTLPYVSTATAQIPLPPFGMVGLDPSLMIPLQPIVIPQPAGVGSVTETIPNNPSLVGCSIHSQALLLQWPTAAFLTNVTSDRIVQ